MKTLSLRKFAFRVVAASSLVGAPVDLSAAGSKKPCDVTLTASQLQSLMKQYVPKGSNGRAPAAAFFEVDSNGAVIRSLYTLNANAAQAVASTQKIVSAYAAYRNGGLSNIVTWSSEDRFYDSQGSSAVIRSTKKNPTIGQSVRAHEFLWTLLTHSSNGAALALSRSIQSGSTRAFVASMNDLSYDLIGRETSSFNSYFQNPAGLTDNADRYEFGDAGKAQRSTADNMARLTARIMGDSGFRSTMKKYGLTQYDGGVVTKGGSTQAAGKTQVAFIPLAGCKTKAVAYAVFGEGTEAAWAKIKQLHSLVVKELGY
jgi:D-alanyl-D-alanine carboxypeptidase